MNALEDAIYDALAASAAVTALVSTRIYRSAAPQGATYPYIVIQLQAGGEDNETPTDAISLVYQIRCESSVSAAQAGSVDEAIRTALHEVLLTVTGWTNYWSARGEMIRTAILSDDGTRKWLAGAFYRFRIAQ